MDYYYIAFYLTTDHSEGFVTHATFTHSHKHSLTDARGEYARCRPVHQGRYRAPSQKHDIAMIIHSHTHTDGTAFRSNFHYLSQGHLETLEARALDQTINLLVFRCTLTFSLLFLLSDKRQNKQTKNLDLSTRFMELSTIICFTYSLILF